MSRFHFSLHNMKKQILIISILSLIISMPIFAKEKKTQKGYLTPEEVHVTISPAAQQKADALYESVRNDYTRGKLTPDAVVNKALYHKVWSPQLAARCLQLVADKNPRAMAELGHLYTFKKTAYLFGDKEAEGVRLMEGAAAAGDKKANDYLGIYWNSQKDYAKALKYFNASAPANIPYALTIMGGMYDDGHGVKKDRPKALEYYRRAAELGDADGAEKYGAALQRQWYGKVNMPDAFVWTYIAGDLGNDFARTNLQLPLRGERFGDDKQTAFVRNSFILTDAWNEKYGHKLENEPIYKEGYAAGLPARTLMADAEDPWSLFYIGSMSYNDEFLNHKDDFIQECYTPLLKSDKLPAPALALVYERMADIYRKGGTANARKADELTRRAAELGSLKAYKIIEKIPD